MAFNSLPMELNAHICSFLESDKDVASFISTCKSTRDAILADGSPFWRVQFAKYYDLFAKVATKSLRAIFQNRRKTLRRGASFTLGKTEDEQRCLQVLRDLMLESYLGNDQAISNNVSWQASLNLESIKSFVLNHDFLHKICSPRLVSAGLHPSLSTVQVMLSFFLLNGHYKFDCLGFPDSQRAAYQTPRRSPIFKGTDRVAANSFLLLQIVNFFRYHLTEYDGALSTEYLNLPGEARPKAWEAPIVNGSYRLGRHWKGTYSFVTQPELQKLRQSSGLATAETFDDLWSEQDGGIQSMDISFTQTPQIDLWPNLFEQHLRSLSHPSYLCMMREAEKLGAKEINTSPRRTRAQSFAGRTSTREGKNEGARESKRNISPLSFTGVGNDNSNKYFSFGWLTPLPPQSKTYGWMRFTMMKVYPDLGMQNDLDEIESLRWDWRRATAASDLWAYEGVVIPGGQIIVGRWWHADEDNILDGPDGGDDTFSGPFIFWSTTASSVEGGGDGDAGTESNEAS